MPDTSHSPATIAGTAILVLVHGAGHTARAWEQVRSHLRAASIAVDLPGRRARPGDLTTLTIDAAADSVVRDLAAAGMPGRVVLVGHSAGGIVLPAVAARLGERVEHLVFVAGLIAAHGRTVGQTLWPDGGDPTGRIEELRADHVVRMLEPSSTDGVVADGVVAVDARTAMQVDSLNLMNRTVSWDGVPARATRTFVRCTRDEIQSPAMQERLAAACDASRVVDLDSGHNATLEVPDEVAAILEGVAAATAR